MKIKSIISMLITLSAFVLFCCATASAETYGDLEYEILSDGTLEITAYNGTATEVAIPSQINGKKVTCIGGESFKSCRVTQVIIPDTVKTIGFQAFAFSYIESITLPDSVITLEDECFRYCTELKNIKLSNALKTMGDGIFAQSNSINSIEIPASVTSLSYDSFPPSCTNITVASGNMHYASVNGVVFNKNKTELIKYPGKKSGKTYDIPSSVKCIGESAFSSVEYLEELNVPKNVTSLGSFTFAFSKSLKRVTFANGITEIPNSAFSGCLYLESVNIPGTVKTIQSNAFDECYSLTSLRIPSSVSEINCILSDNINLEELVVDPQNPVYTSADNVIFSKDMTELITVSVKKLSNTSYVVPSTVRKIRSNVFENCINLVITIPENVTSLDGCFGSLSKNTNNVTIICSKVSEAYETLKKVIGLEIILVIQAPSSFKMDANSSTSIRLMWDKVADADGYIIEQYRNGSWTRIKKITSPDTLKYSVGSLPSGTEFNFRIQSFKKVDDAVEYSCFSQMAACTKPAKATAKMEAVSSSSIRLTWNKVTGASGYIIEQYKNGQWVRIKKITTPTTLKYSIGSLNSGTTYKFRVQAFKTYASKAYYGSWSQTVTASTNPAKVTAKMEANSKISIRLAWNKVTGASGYIIEQYKNGQWVRIKKITTPTTLKYSIGSLKSCTTYKFRVRAYKTLDSKAYLGAWSTTVTAKTK